LTLTCDKKTITDTFLNLKTLRFSPKQASGDQTTDGAEEGVENDIDASEKAHPEETPKSRRETRGNTLFSDGLDNAIPYGHSDKAGQGVHDRSHHSTDHPGYSSQTGSLSHGQARSTGLETLVNENRQASTQPHPYTKQAVDKIQQWQIPQETDHGASDQGGY
jgi:hypothetical protein